MRIAMWSGPRNLSTALMYSFAARSDCAVTDEPFYAPYLDLTGLEHPMRPEILAAHDTNPTTVATRCRGDIPQDKPIWYQKHMCQHMVDGIDRDFMKDCTNVFLIRHPARVIASYHAKHENPRIEDIGALEQADLFDQVSHATRTPPIVIDSADIRANPDAMMRKLCDALGIAFQPSMLNWPAGGHADDGVWAKHWYPAVWNSTGFAGVEGPLPKLADNLQPVLAAALPAYAHLSKHALKA